MYDAVDELPIAKKRKSIADSDSSQTQSVKPVLYLRFIFFSSFRSQTHDFHFCGRMIFFELYRYKYIIVIITVIIAIFSIIHAKMGRIKKNYIFAYM